MESKTPITLSVLPEEGLRFFHGLANWVETWKKCKPKYESWKKGKRHLTKAKYIKPKKGEDLEVPILMPCNTIYLPLNSSACDLLRNIRNAFCHNDLSYDESTQQYQIKQTDKVHIGGKFTLEAIEEFVNVYFTQQK